jgi:hypothetical protein
VTFTTNGTYTLRLTASDGLGQSTSDVVITVGDGGATYTLDGIQRVRDAITGRHHDQRGQYHDQCLECGLAL